VKIENAPPRNPCDRHPRNDACAVQRWCAFGASGDRDGLRLSGKRRACDAGHRTSSGLGDDRGIRRSPSALERRLPHVDARPGVGHASGRRARRLAVGARFWGAHRQSHDLALRERHVDESAGRRRAPRVGPDGTPWVVNAAGHLYHYVSGAWIGIGGSSTDLAVDAAGNAWVVSKGSAANNRIWKYDGSWHAEYGASRYLAAMPDSLIYAMNASGKLYQSTTPAATAYTGCRAARSWTSRQIKTARLLLSLGDQPRRFRFAVCV